MAAQFPYFTEEHELIRRTVRRFAKEEIAPHAAQWDEEGIFPRELFKKAAALGLFGIRMDPKYGGSGMDWWASAAYLEEMAHGDNAGVAMALMVQSEITIPVIAELGTEDQKSEYLPAAIAGDSILALGISEPGAGSDVAGIQCRAKEDGGDLVIDGQKLWITNSTRAEVILLAVRTGDDPHKGISLVLFPTNTPGFHVGKKLKKVGNLASDTGELFFEDCRIPKRNVLGEWNRGFYYIMHNFQGERLALALEATAYMDRAISLAMEYGASRKAFGRPVGSNQVWRHKLAGHVASIEAGRWLNYRALDLMNRGERCLREVTMAKLFNAELAQSVVYDCMQIFGGFGYTTEYPIGRLWRDVRLFTIGAGTSEIMREILAKNASIAPGFG